MRIGIAGISGRMGRLLAEEVRAAGAIQSGGVSRPSPSEIAALARDSDALVDFSHGDATLSHAEAAAASGCAYILGTTGIPPSAEQAVRRAAEMVAVVRAANFSPGMTILLHLAATLARALPADEYDAEIVEMHHRHKRDAPSGTALALGEAVASGRGMALRARDAQAGPRTEGTIGFAALRGGEVVGEHMLLFAGAGDHLSLTHRAMDRRIFATGAIRAALWTQNRPPGLYSMIDVLGLGERRT